MTVLYLIRHAQAHPGPEVPEPEWPLSEAGKKQAAALAPLLRRWGIEEVYTSPYRRCVETISPFCEIAGKVPCREAGLRERKVTPGWMEDTREVWRRSWEDFSFALPGCENSLECRARMLDAVSGIMRRTQAGTIAICGHGSALAIFMSAIAPGFGFAQANALRTPEALRVVHSPQGFRWDAAFAPGPDFDRLATDFRQTPGLKLG